MLPHQRKTHEEADARARKFIDMFERGLTSVQICEEMGWTSKNPGPRVTVQRNRLMERGYEIGLRGSKKAT